MQDSCQAVSNPRSALFWTTCAFFAGFAGVAAFGPIIPKIKESMELRPILAGLLGSSPALTGSLLRIPFGALVDRMGGKKIIILLLVLSAIGLAGTTLLFYSVTVPQIQHYPLFLLFGVMCGCGIAVFSVGIPTVSYWYPQRKQGTALAMYGGLGNLAPGLFSLALPFLVLAAGLIFSYSLWLLFLIAIIVLFSIYMKDAPYFQYREMGLEIDPEALAVVCGEELLPSGRGLEAIRTAGGDFRTWILTFQYFISFGGFIALTVWFPTFWSEYFRLSLVVAGGLTAMYSLSSSILRVFGGMISDRFGGLPVCRSSFVIVAVGSLLLAFCGQSKLLAIAGAMLMALGMGFANAGVFKLVPLFMPKAVGGTSGIVGGLGATGGFIITLVLSGIVDLGGRPWFAYAYLVFTVLSLAALVLIHVLGRIVEKGDKPNPAA